MKYARYLLLLSVFFACKEQKKEASETTGISEKQTLEWLQFEGSDEKAKHIVLISGDEEYRSEEALPQLAKILSGYHGFKCTVLFAQDPERPGIVDPNHTQNIPGLEVLKNADLMVIFTRFRALPDEQMANIESYLMRGKPVVGIRTATHAFKFEDSIPSSYKHYGNYYDGPKADWSGGFGRLVLGEKWIAHHGHHKHQSTRGVLAEQGTDHPIAKGIRDGEIWGSTDVYEVRLPLPGDSRPIVLGRVIDRSGPYDENDPFFGMKPTDSVLATANEKGIEVNDTLMPIAWTKTYQLPEGGKEGRAFTSTIGSSTDLLNEGTRRLLVNGVYWAMDLPVPDKARVDLVGDYQPSAYSFQSDEYWDEKQLDIHKLQ